MNAKCLRYFRASHINMQLSMCAGANGHREKGSNGRVARRRGYTILSVTRIRELIFVLSPKVLQKVAQNIPREFLRLEIG